MIDAGFWILDAGMGRLEPFFRVKTFFGAKT